MKGTEVLKTFRRGRLDILGIQETHIKGYRMSVCMSWNEFEVWEGMDGETVWCGVVWMLKVKEKTDGHS